MATYVTLVKLTDQGRRRLKQTPQDMRQVMRRAAEQGITFRGWYLTMGPYDSVAIVEAPGDEAVAVGVLGTLLAGDIETLTMRAFTLEETEALVGRLPPPA
jgi:uncharacterized protein with GYD domain